MTSYTPATWPPWIARWLLFTTENPFSSAAWSDPVVFIQGVEDIDPDLFWDDDGTLWVASAGIRLQKVDVAAGTVGPVHRIWNGTEGVGTPEGPHLIKRDGWYYLLISEGGTELGHRVSMARAKDVLGPYEAYAGNPMLTNINTTEYFQTVGHADLFQDERGNWWGSALATRSGPQWHNYPMGREAVLFPVTWNKDQWPVMQPVRGRMDGWARPAARPVGGEGAYVETPDVEEFAPGTEIPRHFLTWRFPREGAFTVSPPGHPYTLRLRPTRANLTSSPEVDAADGKSLALLMRVQTDTCFSYSVDVEFSPKHEEEEAGVTAFLTQLQHIDLGIVMLPQESKGGELGPHFRFRVTGQGNAENGTVPATSVMSVPQAWLKGKIRLQIDAVDEAHFVFSAAPASDPSSKISPWRAPATILSGDTGPFMGKTVSFDL
jgi:beta-xylosidase